ncbi:class I SAM-dependent methyltransferase [Paenibacillus sp. DMB20]|uniref:class I SAM-dependent methyltransferase n=1 Tax=Paenibacillus sp. DMB20 TaxID=1642570 RepID=UPI0009E56B3F
MNCGAVRDEHESFSLKESYCTYSWLQESARHFPNKNVLKQMLLEAGFSKVDVKSYSEGVAAMHKAIK